MQQILLGLRALKMNENTLVLSPGDYPEVVADCRPLGAFSIYGKLVNAVNF